MPKVRINESLRLLSDVARSYLESFSYVPFQDYVIGRGRHELAPKGRNRQDRKALATPSLNLDCGALVQLLASLQGTPEVAQDLGYALLAAHLG